MTLSKSSSSMDKRHSISKTFSWLPTPLSHINTKENRHRSAAPTISTTPISTTPSLSSSSSSSISPTTRKFGFFSKFRSSATELDQIMSSDEDEEDHQTPLTPRDSQHLIPTTARTSISSHSHLSSTKMDPSTTPLVTMTAYMHHDISTRLPDRSSLSPPPKPPLHASLNQHVQNILAYTFDSVDEMIEKEWELDRHQLEKDLLTPAPFQFS